MTHRNVSGFKALIAGLSTNYKGARGPPVVCCMAQEGLKEEINKEEDEEIATKKDV